MDYLLENLGPERFQELCHALLAKSFPKTQCFPIGQRDGGRDALSFIEDAASENFIVFQVKFVRRPLAEKNPHVWLKQVVADEAPKLRELIPNGADEYFILTNVPGTAFPESGSIDTVQQILSNSIDIPAQCWWRDDLNRRLDDAWNIKWEYPEILTAADILRYLLEHRLAEDADRRISALRVFLRDQFERDKDVRFKQVELQNRLLDLFVDVPLRLRESVALRKTGRRQAAAFFSVVRQNSSQSRHSHEEQVGAATFLLHHLAQQHLPRTVVEGAPGQGKSTIVQYVCQIHRQRILNEGLNDPRIPDSHRLHSGY